MLFYANRWHNGALQLRVDRAAVCPVDEWPLWAALCPQHIVFLRWMTSRGNRAGCGFFGRLYAQKERRKQRGKGKDSILVFWPRFCGH
jgi:hypothetical protein